MKHDEFTIGGEFFLNGCVYRCTDIGTRTVVAILLDQVRRTRSDAGTLRTMQLSREEAEADGWFNGPPYAVVEHVFDENDMPACHKGRR